MNPSEVREKLKELLGREITVSAVTFKNVRGFLADYVNFSAPVSQLFSETEDGAVINLYQYLTKEEKVSEPSV